MASPLKQFEIQTLVPIKVGGIDISFTNSSLFMTAAVVAITLFLTLSMRRRSLVPGRWQSLAEIFYEFIAGMIRDNVGPEGRKYFPFIFTLFMFILFGNLIGLIPYSFTFTSHIIVTFGIAMAVFVGVTIIGFVKHGWRFFGLLLPQGVPWYIAPLLVPIELLSYFTRPVSLSLRLFANMTAGHTMLKVFAGFVAAIGMFGFVPLIFVAALTGLEFLIACLQAYVFTILSCIYLNDALHMH
ncbi:MAG: F0F1 ATP synthase subunit A [Rhodospirillales bacterium]|jgi:F-type H+-transporting ATPase subunit a|nr:F0F1 ATP synthase subunit A [Rhodospirillales bacterium]HIJ43777.1 F0F1 ATP synthase subunit A [Rhodospirillaceae bacterium]MDP7097704.1 F0F1 ATP synthase subunit A [Rhodospirillales bacterium]MDP7216357.1 F0F1 ATP synthase subunit A [Rhodospirillales bacterium]HIJ44746.1 F0F1 ATP synthase subunit A [Rhodospirillaceae bacterium]